jgi:predicted nucleic acid-binding protein
VRILKNLRELSVSDFQDRRLSFTDCTSFALIDQANIEAVFAFDEHFKYHPCKKPVKFLG